MITMILFASALINHGLGYGSISLFHPMLVISLKNFRLSNFLLFCKENKPLVFMALYAATSILWSTSARIGVRELALILMGEAIVFFVVYSEVSAKQLFKVLKCVMWLNLIICVGESLNIFRYPFSMYSPLAPYFARNFIGLMDTVPTGFYYNPNNNALFILIFSPIMFSVLQRKWKVIYLASASFVVFMATSKLILVAWIFFLIILSFGVLIKKIGLLKTTFTLILSGLFLVTLLFFSSEKRFNKYQKTIPSILTFSKEAPVLLFSRLKGDEIEIRYNHIDNSLHERLLLLDGLAKVLSENWLWGIGGGSLEPIKHTQQNVTMSLRMPHFYFLEVMAKYGFVYFAVYLFWIGSVLKNVAKINPLFGFSLILFVIFSPVISSATYFIPKWGLYALLVKVIKTEKEESNDINLFV